LDGEGGEPRGENEKGSEKYVVSVAVAEGKTYGEGKKPGKKEDGVVERPST